MGILISPEDYCESYLESKNLEIMRVVGQWSGEYDAANIRKNCEREDFYNGAKVFGIKGLFDYSEKVEETESCFCGVGS